MRIPRRVFVHVALCLVVGWALVACGGGGGDESDAGLDSGDGGGGDGNATFVKPEGYASVTFFVDDTANQTYRSGDIEWKGSFVYDPATNIVVHDPSWAAEVGPYPVLHDDGPIATGGHERPGATAGDHIFSVEVYVKADEAFDAEFQYGAINEFDNWIWEGPNGEFVLPAGSTGRIDAAGYTIHAFGTYDLVVSLDSSQLNPDFLPFDPGVDKIYLKGSMNSWDRRQLLDNGEKMDAAAGDGVFTYHHAENLGPHDGLLFAGQHVQFVFMINELEYKRIDALGDGVNARTNCSGPDAWQDVPIFMEPESRGRIKNTTVAICEGGGDVSVTSVVPASGPPAGGTQVAIYGAGFDSGATVSFGGVIATGIQFVDAGQINCLTPAGEAGQVAVRVTNPGGDFGELLDGFAYAAGEAPEILFLTPAVGPPDGGTSVTITGRRFQPGATVAFGGVAATGVSVAGATELSCSTPAHAAGKVDVTVTNPGGLSGSFPDGFEYVEGSGPFIDRVEPAAGSTAGGDAVTVWGSGFSAGASVSFGGLSATDVVVTPPGSIACTTPAHDAGPVDVRVVNPDAQEATLPAGFTYETPRVDWAILQHPLSMNLGTGELSPEVYGQVYEPAVTEGTGCGPGIQAQLGFGPSGSVPGDDPGAWTWTDATCNDQCTTCGNNDEYLASFSVSTAGTYHYAYRFSMDNGQGWVYADGNGSQDGYQPDEAGSLTVQGGGEDLAVWSLDPPAGTVLGGTPVRVLGTNFQDGAVVSLDGETLDTAFVSPGELTVTTLAHGAGAVGITVTNPDDETATLPGGYSYVLRATPDLDDGVIETTSGQDWHEVFLAGANADGSNWGSNHADQLYLAFDDTHLYLGIVGWVDDQVGNALVVYIDTDYGPATGVIQMDGLTDDAGALDNVISSICTVGAPGFGAEAAVGTKGMAGVEESVLDENAGLRLIASPATPDNFFWLPATVRPQSANQVVEIAVPWTALLPGGLPEQGVAMAVFARLLNHDGQYLSEDTLPFDDPAAPQEVNEVFVFEAR